MALRLDLFSLIRAFEVKLAPLWEKSLTRSWKGSVRDPASLSLNGDQEDELKSPPFF
jgi:hypothetical protein